MRTVIDSQALALVYCHVSCVAPESLKPPNRMTDVVEARYVMEWDCRASGPETAIGDHKFVA